MVMGMVGLGYVASQAKGEIQASAGFAQGIHNGHSKDCELDALEAEMPSVQKHGPMALEASQQKTAGKVESGLGEASCEEQDDRPEQALLCSPSSSGNESPGTISNLYSWIILQ